MWCVVGYSMSSCYTLGVESMSSPLVVGLGQIQQNDSVTGDAYLRAFK